MPRNQGTSRKGKPGKFERAAGMGKALQRASQHPSSAKGERDGMARRAGISSIDHHHDDNTNAANNTKSILERNDLDEFLHQADLADRAFATERENRVVVDATARAYIPSHHGTAVSAAPTKFTFRELSVPRRPAWDATTTKQELEQREREAFLDWRRAIALREEQLMLLETTPQQHQQQPAAVTPFEKNLQVWRQLWRVLERSACLLQILDARNPLFYLSNDLKEYAKSLGEGGKPMMILINKSDYLTAQQRRMWSDYLVEQGWEQPVFFSAALEQEKLDQVAREEKKQRMDASNHSPLGDSTTDNISNNPADNDTTTTLTNHGVEAPLTRQQLIDFLLKYAQSHGCEPDFRYDNRIQFGMVGFPNVRKYVSSDEPIVFLNYVLFQVGKSSVINVLMGNSKHTHGKTRVGVASQPGKTKHFQTLNLSDDMMLCDCPGLVFPSFVSNTADLIAAGVYPIAQMRDFWPVMHLICERIPHEVLQAHYGLAPSPRPPTTLEFLDSFCIARSLLASASGVPDHQRASRMIVKDYAVGKLLYCHPPPGSNERVFTHETRITMLDRTEKLRRKLGNISLREMDTAGEEEEEEQAFDPEFVDRSILDVLDMESASTTTSASQPQLNKHGKASKRGKTPKQKWGKKDRKNRDKDPYGCHSAATSTGGSVIGVGRNSQANYTRPVTYPIAR